MSLLSEIKYEPTIKKIRSLEDISPQSVLSMLHDVRESIGKLDSDFVNSDLTKILSVIENGTYEVNGIVSTRIDLSYAKGVVEAYKKYSEGGCQSCVSFGRETIDAQDATSGWYCEISDPDYDENARGDRLGVRYEGFSPKINKYYKNPCDSWKPTFFPTLNKLIEQE